VAAVGDNDAVVVKAAELVVQEQEGPHMSDVEGYD